VIEAVPRRYAAASALPSLRESGCGKTSFLQAGLWPRLVEQGHRCLYVKLTDLDPMDSIRSALSDQFKLPKEAVDGAADFVALQSVAWQADSRLRVWGRRVSFSIIPRRHSSIVLAR